MARGRMIDKVVILSKKVNAVSEGAENLYYRVNISADDFGRYHADTEILKGKIYTLRKISLKEIARRVDELWQINLIMLYEVKGERYLEVVDFEKHQTFKTDRAKKAEYPEPKEYLKHESGGRRDPFGNQPAPNGSLSKDKLSKDKLSKEKAEKPAASLFDKEFEDFWKGYPSEGKVERKTAYKKFTVIAKAGKLAELKKGFGGYMDYLKHRRLNEGFVKIRAKDAKTFLNHYDEFLEFVYKPKM